MARLTITNIDRHIGVKIRQQRIMLGKTQLQIAQELDITYQQQHKYEMGINRTSASRLFKIAKILNVPLSYFFDEIGTLEDKPADNERMHLELNQLFVKLNSDDRTIVTNLARTLGNR